MSENQLLGKWKLVEVDDWEEEEIDEFEPAMLDIRKGGKGSFNFIASHAVLDWKMDDPKNIGRIDFSFMGDDDGTEVFGRGWAEFDGGEVTGEISYFQGDRYQFRAVKNS
jgi:hypothetical protein